MNSAVCRIFVNGVVLILQVGCDAAAAFFLWSGGGVGDYLTWSCAAEPYSCRSKLQIKMDKRFGFSL